MLANVKSLFILKKIINHLNIIKGKLKLFKYSKYYQNKLNLDLYTYKMFSGRYIIYETKEKNGKRKGKEFDCFKDKFIFEGEYLNGKRNGKGKENDDYGKLLFEGEYKNGLRWNGKGYDNNNNILYELKDGKGYIKEYYSYSGILEFEGEYLNGLKNGKGKEYDWDGNLKFEGIYLNGFKIFK